MVRYESKELRRDIVGFFNLSIGRKEFLYIEMRKIIGEIGLMGEMKSVILDMLSWRYLMYI